MMLASHWLVVSLILVALELLFGAEFFFLWLACAALGVAWVTLAWSLAWPTQLMVFSAALVVVGALWWHVRPRWLDPSNTLNNKTGELIGRTYVLSKAIVQGRGQVRIQDAVWQVHGDDHPEGTLVRVVGVEGAILKVTAAEQP